MNKKNQLSTLLLIVLYTFSSYSQDITLSGKVVDSESNETLIGVTISIPELSTGTSTNEYGFYSISIPSGTYSIEVSYLGYHSVKEVLDLTNSNTTKDFHLLSNMQELEEVILEYDVERIDIKSPQMSVNKINVATIKKMPAVLGEVDLIKSILLLPGVSNTGEASAGFHVRGGGSDQNLILLDEATVFNSDHLFGSFSVFNPDAVKNVQLYKGGIPARYGGRTSSILDIYQKDGNSKKYSITGGIGALASRLLVEGPINKNKSSFLLGGRASYAHLFLKLTDNNSLAYFYDLNGKLTFNLNKNNSLFISSYFGRDTFEIGDRFNNSYGNGLFNLRWNHLFSDKLFSNLSLIFADYFYGITLDFVGFKWNSGIQNFNFKYDLKHYISNKLKLEYGINNIYYKFNPGEIKPQEENSGVNYFKLVDKFANETALYINSEQKLTNKLSVEYGLRFSFFNRLGQEEVNVYENNQPVLFNEQLGIYEKATPIDTIKVSRSNSLKTFSNLEPRFALSYSIDNMQSIKLSYNRMTQYLHLISNTISATPLDVWAPSGTFIKPQLADQVAVGYFKNISDQNYSLQTEIYYKEIKNRIDYIDGANLVANNAIEQVILNGESRAYGVEVLLNKNHGRLQGWVAYTLSKSEQRTPGRNNNEPGINNGNWYLTPYDKTHDFSITANYTISKKWNLNSNFVFQTGRATTYPSGQYRYENLTIPRYETRNNDRLPLYHRLDFSAIYTPKPSKNKVRKSEWVFSIYNIYNRKNTTSITFNENLETKQNEAIKLSIFGIIPSVTYNFNF